MQHATISSVSAKSIYYFNTVPKQLYIKQKLLVLLRNVMPISTQSPNHQLYPDDSK